MLYLTNAPLIADISENLCSAQIPPPPTILSCKLSHMVLLVLYPAGADLCR